MTASMTTRMGQAITVLGPVDRAALGVTLIHEHICSDFSGFADPSAPSTGDIRECPLDIGIRGRLMHDPFANRSNTKLDDCQPLVMDELKAFAAAGGETIVDASNQDTGRDPEALIAVARATGLNVIMATGRYQHSPFVPEPPARSIAEYEDEILSEWESGVGTSGVRPGVIGEIGVSIAFTLAEELALRGAARAQSRLPIPLMVHLPAWKRYGHRVLSIVESEGGRLDQTILCHMNPSWDDVEYQVGLAKRGAFLEYDMVGMDGIYYELFDGQCPGDHEAAAAINRLFSLGLDTKILVSTDTFLKMQLTAYGGWGYAHILNSFLPRLERLGFSGADIRQLLVHNPGTALCGRG